MSALARMGTACVQLGLAGPHLSRRVAASIRAPDPGRMVVDAVTTSCAISSNIKLSAWGKYLGDATVTAAILDRLAMTAVRLDIDGPSYRQHLARLRAGEPAAESTDLEAA